MSERLEQFEKQLSRIMQDEQGRELLSKRLNINLVPDNGNRPRVLVMVPSYGNPKPPAQHAWEVMIAEARKAADVHRPMLYGHSIIHWVRNEMIAQAYKDGVPFTHVLMIDDDIEPAPDSLTRMLSHGKDIVAALTTKRADPPIPTLRMSKGELGNFCPLLEWKQGELIEVDAAGTGMMLISKHALDTIAEYYLSCGYEKHALGGAGQDIDVMFSGMEMARRKHFAESKDDRWRLNGMWFQTLSALNGCGEYGEDLSFCLKAKLCGLPVYCDTNVTPLHHGDYGYGIADFFGYKREVIDRAKAEGTYVDVEPAEVAQ